MEWNIATLTEYCETICASQNVEFDIPIEINPRLTRTHGRVGFQMVHPESPTHRHYEPYILEVSKRMIDCATDTEIEDVLKHECAHFILLKRDPTVQHHHDSAFAAVCADLKCQRPKAHSTLITKCDEAQTYKYATFCKTCGFIQGNSRRTKWMSNIDSCKCPKCHQYEVLEVRMNW